MGKVTEYKIFKKYKTKLELLLKETTQIPVPLLIDDIKNAIHILLKMVQIGVSSFVKHNSPGIRGQHS